MASWVVSASSIYSIVETMTLSDFTASTAPTTTTDPDIAIVFEFADKGDMSN